MASSANESKCPVDESTRAAWIAQKTAQNPSQPLAEKAGSLPTERETSSIPRPEGENWVYPSQSQFYTAMSRKYAAGSGASVPNPSDMPVVVPIHNAVNERAWGELLKWEEGRGGEKCGGVKLVSFKGRPKERTWKAWGRVLLGYQPPFDRHDWLVDRCGHKIRYIIDFYTGRSPANDAPGAAIHPMSTGSSPGTLSFYLDVRPAPDSWEGISMRIRKTLSELFRGGR